jgi:hypothetical protein
MKLFLPFQLTITPFAIVLALTSCCSPFTQSFCCAPAECAAAKEGFARYEPILKALESYKLANGEYPAKLEDLNSGKPSVTAKVVQDNLTYVKAENGLYKLEFTYYGPGVNRCSRTPESIEWKCTGYF